MNATLRLATILVVGIVAIAGAVVVIVHPETLSFAEYVKDVATGGGLLAVGYGIDAHSKP